MWADPGKFPWWTRERARSCCGNRIRGTYDVTLFSEVTNDTPLASDHTEDGPLPQSRRLTAILGGSARNPDSCNSVALDNLAEP